MNNLVKVTEAELVTVQTIEGTDTENDFGSSDQKTISEKALELSIDHWRAGRKDEAEKNCTMAILCEQDNYYYWFARAAIREALGRYADAANDFYEAATLDEEYTGDPLKEFTGDLSELYTGDPSEFYAGEIWSRFHGCCGKFREESGNFEAACDSYKMAASLFKFDSTIYCDLARVSFRLGKVKEARKALKNAYKFSDYDECIHKDNVRNDMVNILREAHLR